ncbi:MAG TPA: histidinol-phosphate transaminase [Gammaproteobacteria bacterium]
MNSDKPSSDSGLTPEISALVSQWIRPEVRAITAYHVPDPGQLVKLDAMENPYAWPDSLRGEWLAQLSEAAINRYPDPGARELKSALRGALAIADNHGILLGNGSDELIQMIAMAVARPDRVVLAPEPGFVMYRMIALMVGMRYAGVSLTADFDLDTAAMLAAIKQHQPALVFLAYPNNPTGNLFDQDAIAAILQASPGLVVVDEAYFPFAGSTLIDWLQHYPNLLVMRTVSKMGLAGLRLGYLVGSEHWLQHIDKMRLPYNINVLTQLSVRMALRHIEAFDAQTRQICTDRELLYQQLCAIEGAEVFPSRANFILFRIAGRAAQDIFEQLKTRGILIKNLGNQPGLLKGCLRVTVGTAQENSRFLQALRESIAGNR